MALLFTDSFDHYTNLAEKYDSVLLTHGGAVMSISESAAREAGGGGLSVVNSGTNYCYCNKGIPTSSTVIVGFAFSSNSTGEMILLALSDTTNCQVFFVIQTNGFIQAYTQPVVSFNDLTGATLLGTSSVPVPLGGVWTYLEFETTFSTTAGSITVRMNGINVMSLTGVNTQVTANASVNNFTLGYQWAIPVSSVTFYIDDLYVLNNSGSFNNAFLGDVHVVALLPTGAGESTEWTPNGAGADWECVDDNPPNEGTTYISSSTVGAKDMYTLSSLPNAGTVHGVMVSSYSTKDQAGTRTLTHVVKDTISGNEVQSTQVAPGTSLHFLSTTFDTDPSGNNWSYAEVNQMQVGVEVAS